MLENTTMDSRISSLQRAGSWHNKCQNRYYIAVCVILSGTNTKSLYRSGFFVSLDQLSVTGQNLHYIWEESGQDARVSSSRSVKTVLAAKLPVIPPTEYWRVSMLSLLLEAQQKAHYEAEEEEKGRLQYFIDCTLE